VDFNPPPLKVRLFQKGDPSIGLKEKSNEIQYWNMGRGYSGELSYVWLLEHTRED